VKWKKAIKEMRDKKATGHDDMPGDILKMLREDGLRTMAQLISNIFETGEWPKNFTEVTMIALKKPEATQYRKIAHSASSHIKQGYLDEGLKEK
jgi:hypothetical protein